MTVAELLKKLKDGKFFGSLILKFNDGKVIQCIQEKSIKVVDKN